jgi:NADPH-dependent glutamate synthase beta subunit-like oxidoreductase
MIDADRAKLARCEQCGSCSSACPLTGIEGYNIRRLLRHVELALDQEIAATPQPWQCAVCGRCETACPNGVPILGIVRALRAIAPAELRPEGPPPCVRACPAGIDIPGYLRFIAQGDPARAMALIFESVPFPGILGRVCPHPCEDHCTRAQVNEPVAICSLKRFAADRSEGLPPGALEVQPDTGLRVAVVGAGPAGLTAAFYLRQKGHAVTVFEAAAAPGGMMRYGIPRYRLPRPVLDAEIERVLSLGIELRTGVRLGAEIDLDQLQQDFDAVIVATGLQQSKKLSIEGDELDGVCWGIEFLRAAAEGQAPAVDPTVVVIGGGDVAMDAALTALRLGAREVTVAALEQREQLPAHAQEIDAALAEGVSLQCGWGPRRVIGEGGRVQAVELVRCSAVFDEAGAFNPTFADETRTVQTDQVIFAIGQQADLSFVGEGDESMPVDARGLIVADPETGQTARPGLFAAGEIATGPGALIEAIAQGKGLAVAVDRHLGGDGRVVRAWAERPDSDGYDGARPQGFADQPRNEDPLLPIEQRHAGFDEVVRCLDDEAAVAEAERCLCCDLERALGLEPR